MSADWAQMSWLLVRGQWRNDSLADVDLFCMRCVQTVALFDQETTLPEVLAEVDRHTHAH